MLLADGTEGNVNQIPCHPVGVELALGSLLLLFQGQ